ncbi:TetR/AcrR family transcriptional regulator [Herbiconiux sp. UC225_62]|uniref:TetR/AcrR family transcriptional regulator n=1 Tax=Herbiconiux sp. UC225_62 TaxID=3350168 RepID=UPI0036D30742
MSSDPANPIRRSRADAERNRRRILDAASRVFAEYGPRATLNDVARAGSVGVGTVYRKYVDKEELLDALFDDKIGSILQVVRDAAAIEDAGEAFRAYLRGIIELHACDRSLATVLFGPGRYERLAGENFAELASTADSLIAAAVAAGELHEGFTRQDTVVLAVMVATVAGATRDADTSVWRRYSEIVVHGTRATAGSVAVSHPPLSFAETAHALGGML